MKEENKMTKFQMKGVEFQQNSTSKEEAQVRLNVSCNICALHNLWGDCDHCPINETNKLVIACFADMEEKK